MVEMVLWYSCTCKYVVAMICSISLAMQTPASLAIAAIHGPSSFSSSSSSPGAFSSQKVDLTSEQQPPSASTPLAKNEVGICIQYINIQGIGLTLYIVHVQYVIYMYIRNRQHCHFQVESSTNTSNYSAPNTSCNNFPLQGLWMINFHYA